MTINRIDMEETTDRYAELRDERADLTTAIENAEEAVTEADGIESEEAEVAEADARRALAEWDDDNGEELKELGELIEELRGAGGGDHQWEGDWYPRELIDVDSFEEYAQELADDIGAVPSDAAWPLTCIDWEQAARELAMDYSMVSFRGSDYYWR